MSMDVYAVGLITATEDHIKKVKAYRALEEANLSIPDELIDYFDGEEPSEEDMTISISQAVSGDLMNDAEMIIDLEKLPDSVKKIKIVLSY